MNKSVIIVAGGRGKRFGNTLPKQFVNLGNKPLIVWSVNAFVQAYPEIEVIVAIHEDYKALWKKIASEYLKDISIQTVEGGEERCHSVLNGLKKIKKSSTYTAIHDAARPLISPEFIHKLFLHCEMHGSAVPSLSIADSMRFFKDGRWMSVNRTNYRLIQTPQVFKTDNLLQAYSKPLSKNFTDDASVIEAEGFIISLTEGEERAFKITNPEDMHYAEYLISEF